MESKKVIAITQARVGSTRFPEKILKEINGDALLAIHVRRTKRAKLIDEVVVATTFEEGVEQIIAIAEQEGVSYFQGSTHDVLDRFYQAALEHQPDYVVRVTSDCPLIDPDLIDQVIDLAISKNLDYACNTFLEEFPDGQDCEIASFDALKQAWEEANVKSDREHVTTFIAKNTDFRGGDLFKAGYVGAPSNFNHIRMTVDETEDFDAIKVLVNHLGLDADWKTYTDFVIDHPELFSNQRIIRNEGYKKSIKEDEQI